MDKRFAFVLTAATQYPMQRGSLALALFVRLYANKCVGWRWSSDVLCLACKKPWFSCSTVLCWHTSVTSALREEGVQGHLHTKFKVSLSYMTACLNETPALEGRRCSCYPLNQDIELLDTFCPSVNLSVLFNFLRNGKMLVSQSPWQLKMSVP